MHLKTFSDDDNGIVKISKRLNNGDWDYWLVARLDYLDYYDSNPSHKYLASISVVAPAALPADYITNALDSVGLDRSDLSPEALAVILSDYGYHATIWTCLGNNASALWHLASSEVRKIELLFGFYMDRPLNAIGATGWDFVAGNPLGDLLPKETPND